MIGPAAKALYDHLLTIHAKSSTDGDCTATSGYVVSRFRRMAGGHGNCVQTHYGAMLVLVDYDNLDLMVRRRGVREAVTRIVDTVGAKHLGAERRVEFRLYGGWFERTTLSRYAQRVASDLRRQFPIRMAMAVSGGRRDRTMLVHANLARTLICDPQVAITHTYRQRSLPPRLECATAPFGNCAVPTQCPIASISSFMRDGRCPVDVCNVAPGSILTRPEQKLVDSMLVVDLVHLAQQTKEPIVVVSADDDLWPGIRYALLLGARIIHVMPRHGPSRLDPYRGLATVTYSSVAM